MKKESGAIIYSPIDLIRYLASPFAFSAFRSMLRAPRPMLFRHFPRLSSALSARVSFDMQSREVPTPRREGAKKRCVKLPHSDLKP